MKAISMLFTTFTALFQITFMAQLNLKRPLAFFDLETTGTNPIKDRIVEIAVVKINPDGSRDKWVRRTNPECSIPKEASEVHGIYDKDVADKPTFKDLAHELKYFLNNCDMAGYNSNRFDLPMLAEAFSRADIEIDFRNRKKVDVQQIFFKKEPRTLSGALKFYCNENLEDAHEAEADVNATIDVLEAQLDHYDDLENDVTALDSFSGGNDALDYSRRIILVNGEPCFNFGKYKGKSVADIFQKHPQYYDWMMRSDFSRDTKQVISEILNKRLLKWNRDK